MEVIQAAGSAAVCVQIADVPGRHQPGTGEQPIDAFLDALDRSGR